MFVHYAIMQLRHCAISLQLHDAGRAIRLMREPPKTQRQHMIASHRVHVSEIAQDVRMLRVHKMQLDATPAKLTAKIASLDASEIFDSAEVLEIGTDYKQLHQ